MRRDVVDGLAAIEDAAAVAQALPIFLGRPQPRRAHTGSLSSGSDSRETLVVRAAASPPPRSFWLREAGVDEDGPPLEGERRADVCIVGGGFTGLWTALALKALEPSLELALIEADVCGGGASGRNGGFAMSFWHHFAGLEHACGGAGALALARASAVAVADLGAFCEAHGIDAGFRHDGWLWTATNRAQLGAWESTIAAIARHGEAPFERVEPAALARRSGSAAHLDGVFEPSSATLQPALLARGLARVARERGVALFERSPMRALERARPLVVRTPRGAVRAGTVVIATGAWAGPPRRAAAGVRRRRLRHRDHRARPGRARADRLARRRQRLRLAPDGALLPHDGGRSRRLRQGRRSPRLRRAPARLQRAGAARRRVSPRGCARPIRRWPPSRLRRAGRGRSTAPSTACRSSARSAAPTSSPAPGTRATASARR